jgi:hypothetical protein
MSAYFQQTDCEMAFEIISVLDTALKTPSRTSGLVNQSSITACWQALGLLGATEGSRRRLGLEIEPVKEQSAQILNILQGYKKLAEESPA